MICWLCGRERGLAWSFDARLGGGGCCWGSREVELEVGLGVDGGVVREAVEDCSAGVGGSSWSFSFPLPFKSCFLDLSLSSHSRLSALPAFVSNDPDPEAEPNPALPGLPLTLAVMLLFLLTNLFSSGFEV
jgi:hypothetical protein